MAAPDEASVALVGEEPLPEATMTLVTVDCWDALIEPPAGTVVRKVEVASLTVLTTLAPVDVALRDAVVESRVPFWMVGIGIAVAVDGLLTLDVPTEFDELTQTIDPTCTSFVLSKDGLVLSNARPAVPVPFAYRCGVHEMLSIDTPLALVRKRYDTASRALFV